MIDQPQHSTTLRVCLEDVGTHNKAVLDFFFAKLGQQTFHCVDSQDEANVLIIDYDFPPARQRYESEYQAWNKPAIILSISEVSLDNVIWLAKPLTSRALLDAATSVQGLLNSEISTEAQTQPSVKKVMQSAPAFIASKSASLQRPITKPAKAVVSTPLVSPAVREMNSKPLAAEPPAKLPLAEPVESLPKVVTEPIQTHEAQHERWSLLCGDSSDVDVSTDLASLQGEESFFLSSVKDAVRLARQCQQGVLLNFPQTKIYVLPEVHRVFCTVAIDHPEFIQLISACNSGDGGKMHILSTPEIHELNDLILQKNDALYDLESFVWTSTLLSAQGVLPRELDPNKHVGLKHWPSMTRVELFPHVMPIAAQWSTSAMSAFDVAKSLNIPQRYVFSFYNAANTLGLIEMDPDKLIKKQSVPRATEAPSGLFSRLLKRLIGG